MKRVPLSLTSMQRPAMVREAKKKPVEEKVSKKTQAFLDGSPKLPDTLGISDFSGDSGKEPPEGNREDTGRWWKFVYRCLVGDSRRRWMPSNLQTGRSRWMLWRRSTVCTCWICCGVPLFSGPGCVETREGECSRTSSNCDAARGLHSS